VLQVWVLVVVRYYKLVLGGWAWPNHMQVGDGASGRRESG
jgi:hypothetical protein